MPRGLTAQEISRGQKRPGSGDILVTSNLDASNTIEIIKIANPAEKITWQRKNTLAGTIEFSANGEDFQDSTVFNSASMGSYSTNLISAVRVTRTGGEGKLVILVK